MTWLILIVRLGRAAPRYQRRVAAELWDAGAVPISEGVWSVPDTGFHRARVDAALRRAVRAGGDILIMPTSPANAPSHEVLEAKLAERLTADSAAIDRRCDELTAGTEPGGGTGSAPADSAQELRRLGHDAQRLSLQDVVGLEVVRSAVARVAQTRAHRGISQ